MRKLKPQLIRLIASSTSALVCLTLLIVSMFAWYVTNKTASATGGMGVTADCDYIHFKDEVTAVKYGVSGAEVHTVFTRGTDGSLTLKTYNAYTVTNVDAEGFDDVKDTVYVKSGSTFSHPESYSATATYFTYSETAPENKNFLFTDNLPGDHVDITIGYYMDDEMDGQSYNIKLADVTGGSFVVDSHTHYSVGVFNYKSMSLKTNGTDVSSFQPYQVKSITESEFVTDGTLYTYDDGTSTYSAVTSGTYSSDTTYYTSDYTCFYRYDIAADDPSSTNKVVLHDTWDKDNKTNGLDYTFSIQEDFTAYYDLVSQAEGSYANLLNSLRFNIGNVMVMQG